MKTKNAKGDGARFAFFSFFLLERENQAEADEETREKKAEKGQKKQNKTHTGYAGSCSATDTPLPNIICSLPMSHLLPSEMKTSSGFSPHEA